MNKEYLLVQTRCFIYDLIIFYDLKFCICFGNKYFSYDHMLSKSVAPQCIVQQQGGSYPHHYQPPARSFHPNNRHYVDLVLSHNFIQFPNWVKHRTIFVSRSGADDTD